MASRSSPSMEIKTTMTEQAEISLVVPAFNESGTVGRFVVAALEVLETVCSYFEIVIVDDGSNDQTWEEIENLALGNAKVRGIRLLHNYGKEIAVTAGLFDAKGRAHIPIDVDFQDPLDALPKLIEMWREGYPHVVVARQSRADRGFRGLFATIYYRLQASLSSGKYPENVGDFRIIDASITERLRSIPERRRINKSLFGIVSPPPEVIVVDRPKSVREGRPRQTPEKLFDLAIVGLSANPDRIIRAVLGLGLGVTLFAVIAAPATILLWLFGLIAVPGQATVLIMSLLLLGVSAVSFGVLGTLASEILKEVKQRPLFLVRQRTPGSTD